MSGLGFCQVTSRMGGERDVLATRVLLIQSYPGYVAVEPHTNGAESIMVEGHPLAKRTIGLNAVPSLPDGRGSLLDLVEP